MKVIKFITSAVLLTVRKVASAILVSENDQADLLLMVLENPVD
jgi:hypothetical protein